MALAVTASHHYGKQYRGSSKYWKNRATIWFNSPTPRIYIIEMTTRCWRNKCMSMFTVALFTIPNAWKQRRMDKDDVVCVCVYIYILFHCIMEFNHKKEGNPTTWNHIVGPWGHYAKWNNPNIERQILYGIMYMWKIFKSQTLREQKNSARGYRMGEIGRSW